MVGLAAANNKLDTFEHQLLHGLSGRDVNYVLEQYGWLAKTPVDPSEYARFMDEALRSGDETFRGSAWIADHLRQSTPADKIRTLEDPNGIDAITDAFGDLPRRFIEGKNHVGIGYILSGTELTTTFATQVMLHLDNYFDDIIDLTNGPGALEFAFSRQLTSHQSTISAAIRNKVITHAKVKAWAVNEGLPVDQFFQKYIRIVYGNYPDKVFP